ncbi:MAG: carboxypeptidase regulatory-like domain-containing protein [Terriglobia bacterium]
MKMRRIKTGTSGVLASLSCVLLAGAMACAQTTGTGTITGTITDPTGAVVPGVHVTATQTATGISRGATTDANGYYVLPSLQIGQYEITASHSGFSTFSRKDVILNADTTVAVNMRLRVGSMTQTVTVTGAPPQLQTESGAVNTLVSGVQVQELALNGRNFTQLLTLGPGVTSKETGLRMGVGQEGNPLMSVNGGRINSTEYTYDGILAMDTGGNRGLDLFPPMEAIQEVQIHKSNYTADTGSYGYGQVNVVTKSGGREYHGSVYEINGNSAFDARNFFANSVSPFNQNMFGYTIGGPVFPSAKSPRHEKVFFFWSEAWNRRIGPQVVNFTSPPQSVFTAETPTAAERSGDLSAISGTIKNPATGKAFANNIIPSGLINPNAKLLLQDYYPLPNLSGAPNYSASTDSHTNWREELGRVDFRLSSKASLMVRYAHDSWLQDQSILKPSSSSFTTLPGLLGKPGQSLVLELTNVLNPSTLNQLTFGFSRNGITAIPGAPLTRPSGLSIPSIFNSNVANVIPTINITGFGTLGADASVNNTNNVYTYRDDLSHQINNHSLKTGFEVFRIQKFDRYLYTNHQGNFTFNGTATGNPLADFLLGDAFEYTEQGFIPYPYLFADDFEFYGQDDWKARPNLTLNIGLREEIMAGAPNGMYKYGNGSDFVPSLYSPAAAPVVSSNGRLVPGTGDPLNGIITPYNQKGLNLPPSLKTTGYLMLGPRFGFAWSPGRSQKTVLRGGYGIFYSWDNDSQESLSQNPPFSQSASIFNTSLSDPSQGVAAATPPNLTTENVYFLYPMVQQWSLTLERELPFSTVLSVGYVGNAAAHLDQSFNINQPQPNLPVAQGSVNLNTVRPYLGYGNITYDTRNAAARYNGLQVDVRRHFSHGLMLEVAYTWSRSLCWGVGQNTLLQQNEEGLCNMDQPQNLTVNYVYDLPFFRTQSGIAGKVLGGWELSGITTYASGFPFTIAESGNRSGTGNAGRPNLIAPLNVQPGNVNAYFNTAAFVLQPLGQFGNEGADILRGPGLAGWNVNLYKNTAVRLFRDKRGTLKFGAEFYNVFNTVSFNDVGVTLGTPSFGHLTSALDPREADLRLELTF